MNNWTSLNESQVWNAAYAEYSADARRVFHGWDHILRRYRHALATFGFDYDLQLDLGILCHDVIYDDLQHKELRSAAWLRQNPHVPYCEAACGHIMRTEDPVISDDNRLILIDYADLMFPDTIKPDFDLVKAETMALYNIDEVTFAERQKGYFERVSGYYTDSKLQGLPSAEVEAFRKIRSGMSLIIGHAEKIITDAGQHTLSPTGS